MPEDIPPAPSETSNDAAKAETIRITLPSKPDQPTVKRETVRINLPGKPAMTAPPGVGPKKETTKIPAADELTPTEGAPPPPSAPTPPPAPIGSRPFAPPPPRPPGALGAAPLKPQSGINPPPKPPSLGAKPTVPLKPAPAAPTSVAKPVAPAGSAINPPPEPMTQKAASPKKETARITLPPEGGKAAMPKATIKMQQTQPLIKQPAQTTGTQSSIQPALTTTTSAATAEAAPDGMVNILSIVAVIVSLISFGLVFMAYNASSLH
jgi:hypothetical protein